MTYGFGIVKDQDTAIETSNKEMGQCRVTAGNTYFIVSENAFSRSKLRLRPVTGYNGQVSTKYIEIFLAEENLYRFLVRVFDGYYVQALISFL